MRVRLWLSALSIGALACGAGAEAAAQRKPAAARKAPARKDWSRTVSLTPEGGFRMGNPAAKVKLVEYGSMTCPHCAAFSKEAGPALVSSYVRTGRVSYEFRNFVLNGLDVTATLLARCGGPVRFFALTDRLYATQGQWVGKVGALTAAEKDRLKAMSDAQRLGGLADLSGLTQVAAQGGVAPARGKQCLADPAALQRLGQMAEAANAQGVAGTPTFFLNGANLGTHNWATLEPILREAAG
ncbi:MAG TPA: thioredoxin domain-containing protein [Allosphingosinicella sp.]|jgi:protein-disulfide isomerase